MKKIKGKPHMFFFGVLGLFGGLINLVISASSFGDFLTFQCGKILILGFITGIFYWFLHTEKDYPNSVMTIVSGYAGTAFIEEIMRRFHL